jgi:hypothetical protein
VQTVADGTDTLADTEEFTRAVPDAEAASMVAYADIDRILQAAGDAAAAKKYEGLGSVGFSTTSAENPSFRLRITTR